MNQHVIMNFGFEMPDQCSPVPFFFIDDTAVNYSFIDPDGGFHTPVGMIKQACLMAIADTDYIEITINADTKEAMKDKVRSEWSRIVSDRTKRKAVLFKVEKTSSDDTVFYEAMGISIETTSPISFEEAGYKSSGLPFKTIDLRIG